MLLNAVFQLLEKMEKSKPSSLTDANIKLINYQLKEEQDMLKMLTLMMFKL